MVVNLWAGGRHPLGSNCHHQETLVTKDRVWRCSYKAFVSYSQVSRARLSARRISGTLMCCWSLPSKANQAQLKKSNTRPPPAASPTPNSDKLSAAQRLKTTLCEPRTRTLEYHGVPRSIEIQDGSCVSPLSRIYTLTLLIYVVLNRLVEVLACSPDSKWSIHP